MRVLVCGDRNWHNQAALNRWLDEFHAEHAITKLIEGEARGADKAGRFWAETHGVEFESYPANWNRFGRGAGPIRNQQMLDEGKPEYVLAFHDSIDGSKGTKDMISRAAKAGIPWRVYNALGVYSRGNGG